MAENDIIINHVCNGESSTEALAPEVHRVQAATNLRQNLAKELMTRIATPANLKAAFKAVKRNKGAPGIDKRTICEVEASINEIILELCTTLIDGTYIPSPVRGVEIPKTNGQTRQLGIPTVVDRIVQQAISQVLSPIFDPYFSEQSFGFRPKRSAQQAIASAKGFVKEGKEWVVDLDIAKFFDCVNHDIIMSKLAHSISDKKLLKLIRKFLQAGMMHDGLFSKKEQGMPQGGPLSPLLSNIMLHDLDKELHYRGHTFVRYADDCNIYVASKAAAQRILNSITRFLKNKLKLSVNLDKSAATSVIKRSFLGFTLLHDGKVAISKDSITRFKDKIRLITKRNRGVKIETVIRELNQATRGWFHYFKCSDSGKPFKLLDCWIRRRLRCYRIKQRKRKYSIKTFFEGLGLETKLAWAIACSRGNWWKKSLSHPVHQALTLKWFKQFQLFSIFDSFVKHKSETAVCDIARTVV